MGVNFDRIEGRAGIPLLGNSVRSVLDIGTTNVYDCSVERLTKFLEGRGVLRTAALDRWIEEFVAYSGFDDAGVRRNKAFLWELCKVVGIQYLSLDIFEGPFTRIFDLNTDRLQADLRGRFDLVINLGTTEHVMNQLNAFRAMHDATRVGGHMFHALPIGGYTDHGYIHYTSRFFFDLAGYNDYKIVEIEYNAGGSSALLDSVRAYSAVFPALLNVPDGKIFAGFDTSGAVQFAPEPILPDAAIFLRYEKTWGRAFTPALDTATGVGAVSAGILNKYDCRARVQAVPHPALTADEKREHERLIRGLASLEEALAFYRRIVDRVGEFPPDWEIKIVELSLQREPGRADLLERHRLLKAYVDSAMDAERA
jgi:hypothetical protein